MTIEGKDKEFLNQTSQEVETTIEGISQKIEAMKVSFLDAIKKKIEASFEKVGVVELFEECSDEDDWTFQGCGQVRRVDLDSESIHFEEGDNNLFSIVAKKGVTELGRFFNKKYHRCDNNEGGYRDGEIVDAKTISQAIDGVKKILERKLAFYLDYYLAWNTNNDNLVIQTVTDFEDSRINFEVNPSEEDSELLEKIKAFVEYQKALKELRSSIEYQLSYEKFDKVEINSQKETLRNTIEGLNLA